MAQKLIQEVNVADKVKDVHSRLEETQRNAEKLIKENGSLRSKVEALTAQVDIENKKRLESDKKCTQAESVALQYKSRLPEGIQIEQLNFRHEKHKECLTDLGNMVNTHNPDFKNK